MAEIGQYYYMNKNGAGGRVKMTRNFEDYQRIFGKRSFPAVKGKSPAALLYDKTEAYYFVGKEAVDSDGEADYLIRHGFLFPAELFEDRVFGAKLSPFFDISDFRCTLKAFSEETELPPKERLTIEKNHCDFLQPMDIFRSCREHSRFVRLLLYAALMAITDDFSLAFSLSVKGGKYENSAVLFIRSLFAMIPWELREYLTFHTYVEDRYDIGTFKLSVTPLPFELLPRSNHIFCFDLDSYRVSPDLVIDQKSRGTVTGELLFLIWSQQDEKALSNLIYIFHHNRQILEGKPTMVAIDALSCYFLLKENGRKYRKLLREQISRLSKGSAREILLCLAGYLSDDEFIDLRQMIRV